MPKPVQIVRWQVLVAFVAITLAFVGGIIKVQNESARIGQLDRTNARLLRVTESLELTNCSLKQFLFTARRARIRAETADAKLRDTLNQAGKRAAAVAAERQRIDDAKAAAGYLEIASKFIAVGDRCDVPVGG